MFDGGDISFVGPTYQAPDYLQNAEECINFFVEIAKDGKPKEPLALLGAPGLNSVFSLFPGPVRGSWVLPGGQKSLWVAGNVVYLVAISVPATKTSIAQFSVNIVGNLLTNAGRVVIRDNGETFNGLGGYAVLVDGQYGYFYRLDGKATTVSFTGNLSVGTNTITFPVGQLLPNNLLVGKVTSLTDTAGALVQATIASVDYTANTITLTTTAGSNQTADTFTYSIPAFGQITDPGFLGSDRIAMIQGWLVFNKPGSRVFYTTGPIAYTLTFPGLFFALKDSSSDNLVTFMENNGELPLIGERTMEWWAPPQGPSPNFGFQRIPGVQPQIGCSAKHSIARVGPEIAWLASNENGQNIVVMTKQYGYERVSNHAIENLIASFPFIEDAIGDCYEDLGHVMYVLTFPTADATLVYDLSTEWWWKRLSWSGGVYHRHRGNTFLNFANLRLWGDYQNGQVYQQDRKFYTDADLPLRALRRTPHVWNPQNRKRVFQGSLQVEFTPGIGLQTGQGSNPQAMFRWSDDGGTRWSNEHFVPVGQVGRTRNRAIVRRIGEARDRVYEVSYTEPTPRDIIGATLFAEGEDAPE